MGGKSKFVSFFFSFFSTKRQAKRAPRQILYVLTRVSFSELYLLPSFINGIVVFDGTEFNPKKKKNFCEMLKKIKKKLKVKKKNCKGRENSEIISNRVHSNFKICGTH